MSKLMLEDVDVRGKRVLVRVDFNVPIERGRVLSDKRLRAAIPTILYLSKHGGRVILISHRGRPNGKRVQDLSLKPCANFLSNLLLKDVAFLNDCIGDEVQNFVSSLKDGQIVLLENLRFHEGEIQNNIKFAKKLSELADIYVNDSFGTMHRAHASTEAVTHLINFCAMGFLVKKELSYIGNMLENPDHLFIAVLGGSKISDKLCIINNLLPKVDMLILGGGMAYTFLKARGFEIGDSIFEVDKISLVSKILDDFGDKIVLPLDFLVTDLFDYKTRSIGNTKYVNSNMIEYGWCGIDIGINTISKFTSLICSAKTIIWNGPMGVFEVDLASTGTLLIAKAIAKATGNGAITIIGGGDTALAVEKAGVVDDISHISTGGGASLNFIGGKILPGIAALTNRF